MLEQPFRIESKVVSYENAVVFEFRYNEEELSSRVNFAHIT